MKLYLLTLTCTTWFLPFIAGDQLTKANNPNALNDPGSWVGGVVPGPSDVAVWDATVTGANSVSLGAGLAWQGIRIADPGGDVAISGSETLTLGGSGISC